MGQEIITDAMAHAIASGNSSPELQPLAAALAADGSIRDTEGLLSEIDSLIALELHPSRTRRNLIALHKYVRLKGPRGPVVGWEEMWDETPATRYMC